VTVKVDVRRNGDAAEHERPTRREAVRVVTDPGPQRESLAVRRPHARRRHAAATAGAMIE
jgi:hypothetical protein